MVPAASSPRAVMPISISSNHATAGAISSIVLHARAKVLLDEIFGLVDLKTHATSGEWDTIIVDCAPTAETIRLLTIDPHSPNEFRCNQIVRNIDAFYDAFGVTSQRRMWRAPAERAAIW